MARKTCNIIVKKDYLLNSFTVWMDYEVARIVAEIPGVVNIYKSFSDVKDQYTVAFDPRYDWEELQTEIETLANSYAED